MRDILAKIIDELDGIAEDLNPTPEPEPETNVDTRSVKKKGGTKK